MSWRQVNHPEVGLHQAPLHFLSLELSQVVVVVVVVVVVMVVVVLLVLVPAGAGSTLLRKLFHLVQDVVVLVLVVGNVVPVQ